MNPEQLKAYHVKKKFQLLHGTQNPKEFIKSQKPDLKMSGTNYTGMGDGSFYATNIPYLAKSYGTQTKVTFDPKIKIIEEKYLPKTFRQTSDDGLIHYETNIVKIKRKQNKIAKERGFDAIITHDIGNIGLKADGTTGIVPSRNIQLRLLNPDKVTKVELL